MARGTNLVALAEHDRWIRVIDANSGSEKFRTQAPGKGWLEAVALSADGRILAACSGTDESTISLWDVAGGQPMLTLPGEGGPCWLTAFSPDGNTLVTWHELGMLDIWRTPSWENIAAAEAKEKAENKQP